jgi:hypothetical protein
VGKVTASIDTSRFRGAITKTVRVTADDPAQSVVTLELRADVVTAIDVLPTDSPTLRMAAGESKSIDLTLQATDQQPFTVIGFRADPSVVVSIQSAAEASPAAPPAPSRRVKPVAAGSGRYRVRITPKAGAAIGQSIARVTLKTDRKKAEKIALRVIVAVIGPVQVLPSQIILRPSAKPFEASVLIRKPGGEALRILGVETADPDFIATLSPVTEGRDYKVVVRYSGKTNRGQVRSSLTVKTNEPAQPTIVIPMVGAL